LGNNLIKHKTDSQVIGAALAKRHRQQLRDDPDAMQEDKRPPRTEKSTSLSEEDLSQDKTKSKTINDEMDEDRSMIKISSSTSTSSNSSSLLSSSSTSTSNDGKKTATRRKKNHQIASPLKNL
jgi:hypothetical protein